MEQADTAAAAELLRQAQLHTEELYIDSADDP